MLPKIIIETIPADLQRYETAGDYLVDEEGNWQFRLTNYDDPDYEFRVLIHELTEAYLLWKKGVDWKIIDEWDIAHPDSMDPGMEEGSPYKEEHIAGNNAEKPFVKYLKKLKETK
jgi:hypothetical protein